MIFPEEVSDDSEKERPPGKEKRGKGACKPKKPLKKENRKKVNKVEGEKMGLMLGSENGEDCVITAVGVNGHVDVMITKQFFVTPIGFLCFLCLILDISLPW